MHEESLAERIKRLTPAKRRLLLRTLEEESFDTSWVGEESLAPPETETEKILAGLWKEVLGVEAVGRNDSFFDLGGDSILSIRIVARAQRQGLALSSRQLFDHPTISDLANFVTRTEIPVGPSLGSAPMKDPALVHDPNFTGAEDAGSSRGRGWIPRPQDFPEADLSEEDLASIRIRVDGCSAIETMMGGSEWTGSSEAAASGMRYPGQLPRVLALRAARF